MNFDTLKNTFKGLIASPSDGDNYKISRWATNAEKPAEYVVYPVDAQDIASAILFARSEQKSRPFPLAIAGGRHNSSGASSSNGGMVIDMRNVNSIRVDKNNMIVYVGGGTLAKHVAETTFPLGLSTTFGFCGDVGLTGYALGGGVGFHMGEHGLGADNIISAKMVLANGDIVTASKYEHPDLYWGIRGGGSNFGVVAEIGMRLFEQRGTFYRSEYSFSREQLPDLISTIKDWQKIQKPQEIMYIKLLPVEPYLFISCFSNSGSDEQTMQSLIRAVGPKSVIQETPEEPIGAMFDVGEPFCILEGGKVTQSAYINDLNHETVAQVLDEYLALLKRAPLSAIVYELASYQKLAEVPPEATAFVHRTTDAVVLTCTVGFEEELSEIRTASQKLVKLISSSSSLADCASFGYANTADTYAIQSDTAPRLFGVNYPRLQEVKRKYDPDMMFNQWYSIVPS